MGRFPSGRRSGDNPGVLLFASGQAPMKKQFNLTIPPVPSATYEAIVSRITTFQPWLEQKAQLDKAQQKAQLAHDNLVLAQERLSELQARREQARKLRQVETSKALKEIEQSMHQDFEEEMKRKQKQFELERDELEREIVEELKHARTEMEMEKDAGEEGTHEHNEIETSQKRAKLEDDTEKPHRVCLEDDEQEEGEESDAPGEKATLDDKGRINGQEKEQHDESKLSYLKKQEFEAFQKRADELTGIKINMSWLLKTIIQKENEQKKKNNELPVNE
jgi:hypothetical protein